jgi:hypothetical protein
MRESALETEMAEVLAATRDLLGVARARCYAIHPSGDFRLVARYGFSPRFPPEEVLEADGPLIEWVKRLRKPSYANSPAEAGSLGPYMERDQYARVLVAPVYEGSRLLGILELQERLGGLPFVPEDLRRAQQVVSRIGGVLREYASAVVAPEPIPPEDAEALFRDSRSAAATKFPLPPPLFERSASEESALPPSAAAPLRRPPVPDLGRREVLLFKGFGNSLLLSDLVAAAVFSYWTPERGELYFAARQAFSGAAQDALLSSLGAALASARPGSTLPEEKRFHWDYPLGRELGERNAFAGAQTSVVFSESNTLLFTLVFGSLPPGPFEGALGGVHQLVRSALRQTRDAERYRLAYRSLIDTLIEPGARAYPQLKAHSLAVGALCRRFATGLGLSRGAVEQITVAGLRHDVGLKELELPYERLAGRRPLDLEELAVVRQHPVVGASILERIDFPYSIAPLVRHHHERFDGAGYPDRLGGERIPLGARIIALAEAYDAMTAPHSYRAPVSREAALDILAVKGGTQFDPELARRFAELVRSGSAAAPESVVSELPP